MKKFAKIALVLLVLATCICAVVACNDNQNNKQQTTISISNENMPQTVFVKGNELDLSAGKLTVSGKEQTEVALNGEGVVVTGYDKNAVGIQTLTVTYQGATTTFDVRVVERIAAGEKFVTEYVVGEQFDTRTGRVNITKDNGETLSVTVSDKKLTFSGFDSKTAGVKSVNVAYKDDELEYTGSVSVTVYAIESFRLNQAHLVRSYKSHDTELNFSDAHLIITANGGKVSKTIYPDNSMVKTPLDTTLVNEENQTAKQTITICFGDKEAQFEVTITLSDVTRIQNAAKSLAVLDFSGNTVPNVTDAQGELAVHAYELYSNLSDEDKKFINNDQLMSIIRSAAVYANAKWTEKVSAFSSLFEVNNNVLIINCETYADTAQKFAAISALEEDDLLFVYGDILAQIVKDCKDIILFGEKTVEEYLANICSGQEVSRAIKMIDLMLKMHNAISAVPADWKVEDLGRYADAIDKTCELAIELGSVRDNLLERYVFGIVSEWREGDDLVDIIYRYYYSLYLNGDAETKAKAQNTIENMFNSCMPDEFEALLLQYIKTAMAQQDIVYVMSETQFIPASSINTINFVSNFRNLLQIADAIQNSGDAMLVDLYGIFGMDSLVENLQTAELGIMQILGAAYGNNDFEAMWTKYIDAIALMAADGVTNEQIEAIAKDLFETFAGLTPELKIQFVASNNPYGTPEFIPSDGTNRMTLFANLFMVYCNTYLENLMPDEGDSIVFELFDAIQFYMLRDDLAIEQLKHD